MAEGTHEYGMLPAYAMAMLYVFYGFHIVCDEYFVPALNVLCERNRVRDSVAGATVMAAGASSPESKSPLYPAGGGRGLTGRAFPNAVFSNFIAMFLHKPPSDIGTGTVVGSELFNQLVICGVCAVATQPYLAMDWRLLTRELSFYSLSVAWLLFALCIHGVGQIEAWEAAVFLVLHVAYVVTCIFTDRLVALCCPLKEVEREPLLDKHGAERPRRSSSAAASHASGRDSIVTRRASEARPEDLEDALDKVEKQTSGAAAKAPPGAPGFSRPRSMSAWAMSSKFSPDSLRQPLLQPPGGRERASTIGLEAPSRQGMGEVGEAGWTIHDAADSDEDESTHLTPLTRKYDTDVTMAQARRPTMLWKSKEGFQGIGKADGAVLMDGPVHKKNRFNQWERRWLIVEPDRIHYVKSPLTYQDGGYSRVVATAEQAPDFTAARTSQSVHELVITVGDAELIFYVGTEEMRDKWFKELLAWKLAKISTAAAAPETHGHDYSFREYFRSLKYTLFVPLEVLIMCTMPDISKRPYLYLVSILNSCVWMAALSFVMTKSGDAMAEILGLSPAVVGLTVGAAGTSLPNLFASQIVARKGQGEMAIANAFGSNVFNINIALGLPWFCAALAYREPWKIAAGKQMAFNAILLFVFIVFFVIVAVASKFRLYRPIGYLFLACYVLYLAYALAAEYVPALSPTINLSMA